MRDARSEQIEFLDGPDVPARAGVPARQSRTWGRAAALLAAATVAAALAIVATHRAPVATPTSTGPTGLTPVPTVTVIAPSIVPDAPALVAAQGAPSAGMIAAFAAHVPGSAVLYEQSIVDYRHQQGVALLSYRLVRAVEGNVVVLVRITPAASLAARSPLPGDATQRLTHRGFVFDFSFTGFYPPTRAQLRALTADPRLIAIDD